MRDDPAKAIEVHMLNVPPRHGPGSGKEAWIQFAKEMMISHQAWQELCKAQSETIADLQAEVRLLRDQVAKRKPKGARPALQDDRVAEIERDLAAGYSMRTVAARNAVSAMTVSRIAKRIRDRASA